MEISGAGRKGAKPAPAEREMTILRLLFTEDSPTNCNFELHSTVKTSTSEGS
jgi:hypothetical protein